MSKIKAAFFDIDGTIVAFGEPEIRDSVIAALDKARENGVKLFIATGRHRTNIYNIKGYPFDGFICNNGAIVTIGDETVSTIPIPHEDALKIARVCADHKLACMCFPLDRAEMSNPNDKTRQLLTMIHISNVHETDLLGEVNDKEYYQLTVFMTKEQEAEYFSDIHDMVWQRWHPDFTDGNSAMATKSAGMKSILDKLGIARDECIAFGDGGNDISMLEYAGIGVAMGNATEDVKKAADYVTDSVFEEGVISAMRHFGML